MIAGEPEPLCPDVRTTIDAVRLHHGDERLDDLVRVTTARLTAVDLAAWHAWHQDWMLRLAHRVQLAVGGTAAALSVLAAWSALAGDQTASVVPAGAVWSVTVVLWGLVLFVELSMANGHPRFLTLPTRIRLATRIRRRVNLQPLRECAIEELIGGPRADAARLVVVARACAASITGSPGWCADRLDALRVRCDVEQALTRIARCAAALERDRVGTGAGRAEAAVEWEMLVGRVGWLQRYEHQLHLLTADATGSSADRRPAARTDRIVADLRFTVFALTWTD